ncbi:MAG: hypothetical protein AB1Z21_13100 [Synechococcaceae cyanobacterium]
MLVLSRLSTVATGTASALGGSLVAFTILGLTADGGAAQARCRFLMPIGGGGEPVVEKRISPDGLIRRNNWNTDFAVDRAYASYRINLQSASTERGVFPVAAFLRFTDNTDLRVVNENLTLEPQQSRTFGPFPAVPGKRTNQVNVRVGATTMPGSTGFSYRVSVEGCD